MFINGMNVHDPKYRELAEYEQICTQSYSVKVFEKNQTENEICTKVATQLISHEKRLELHKDKFHLAQEVLAAKRSNPSFRASAPFVN